VNPGTAL